MRVSVLPVGLNEPLLAGAALVLLGLLFVRGLYYRRSPGPPTSVCILLLLRNQAPTVEGLLRRLCAAVAGWAGFSIRIVAVDESSQDETALILDRLEGELPVSVIRCDGSGVPALEAGLRACPESIVLLIRLAGETDPGELAAVTLTVRQLLPKIDT